tara:strand:- start:1809 stop:2201 length:393 start_codon:yes stop_codon:yes gene_type:complete
MDVMDGTDRRYYNTSHGRWEFQIGSKKVRDAKLIYQVGPEHMGNSWPLVTTPIGSFKLENTLYKSFWNDKRRLGWVVYRGEGYPRIKTRIKEAEWIIKTIKELRRISCVPEEIIGHFLDTNLIKETEHGE